MNNEQVKELWQALSHFRRTAIDYTEDRSQQNFDYLLEDIGMAYDVLQDNCLLNKGVK
jgi:hypothetical protein